MYINFRHGIINYQLPTFLKVKRTTIDLVVSTTPLEFTIAAGNKNYLFIETEYVTNAWSKLIFGIDQWIYIDYDIKTATRTFGITKQRPIINPNTPTNPILDQHWFDTTKNQMFVWTGTFWAPKVRLILAEIDSGKLPISVSQNSPKFDGTQIGNHNACYAGTILFNSDTNLPLHDEQGYFLTTEDELRTNNPNGVQVKLASTLIPAEALQDLAEFTIVTWEEFGLIVHANAYTTDLNIPFGIILHDTLIGQQSNVILDGIVSNANWNWAPAGINAPLYCDNTGVLTSTPVIPLQTPCAYVLDKHTILLSRKIASQIIGSDGGTNNVPLMSNTVYGIGKLSIPAVSNNDPIVVGDNDPRLYNKVLKSGDTMSGPLILSGNPTQSLHAVTKQYVDSLLNSPLSGLSDVEFTNLVSSQFLQFDGTNWINTNLDINDVDNFNITTPLLNQVLQYNGTQWVNTTIPISVTNLDGLTDVIISSPTNQQILQYNGTNWVNSTINLGATNLDGLNDVVITSPILNQILKFNGTQWVNTSSTTGATILHELNDVTITTPVLNQILQYNGTQWVNILNNLDQLSDVVITTPSNNQVLQYNGTNWVNSTLSVPSLLDQLSDVIITTPINNQILQYNGTDWINSTLLLDQLSDVIITTPSNNQVLQYNGIDWVNSTLVIPSLLDQLSDVVITTPTNNQFLKFDGTNWVNSNIVIVSSLDQLSDVIISSPITNQILMYNGNDWINSTLSSIVGATFLNELNDVVITTPINNQLLQYDGTNWINISDISVHSITISSGDIVTPGDCRARDLVAYAQTVTTDLIKSLLLEGNNYIIIPQNNSWAYDILITCVETTAPYNRASWNFTGSIFRDTNNITLVQGEQSIISTSNSALSITLSIDTVNNALNIEATGLPNTTINWIAKISTVEITI